MKPKLTKEQVDQLRYRLMDAGEQSAALNTIEAAVELLERHECYCIGGCNYYKEVASFLRTYHGTSDKETPSRRRKSNGIPLLAPSDANNH